MDVRIILGHIKDQKQFIEDFASKSFSDSVRFFTEDDKSESELLADCIYEDFVKCR